MKRFQLFLVGAFVAAGPLFAQSADADWHSEVAKVKELIQTNPAQASEEAAQLLKGKNKKNTDLLIAIGQAYLEAIADTIYAFRGSSECPVRGKHTRFIYLSVFSSPSNTLKPTLFLHQQAPELRKETSLLFFGHLNQHLQAFHTDSPG